MVLFASASQLLLILTVLLLFFIFNDILIDQFRVVDKEPGHLFLEELHPSSIILILITERRLIIEVTTLTII